MRDAIYRVTIDLNSRGRQFQVTAKKGDTARSIYATLRDNGHPFELEDGCRCIVMIAKPDGTILCNDCTIKDMDTIVYEFTEQTVSAKGTLRCEFRIFDKDANIISTPNFSILVDDNVYDDGQIISQSAFNTLVNMIHTVGQIDDLRDEVQELANKIVNNMQKTRIDFDGSTFKIGTKTLTYKDLYEVHLVKQDFAFVVYGDRAYLLSYVQDDPSSMRELRFESVIAVTDSSGISNVKVSGIYVTSSDGITIANVKITDINSENKSYKAAEITASNRNTTWYPSVKAVTDYIAPLISSVAELSEASQTNYRLILDCIGETEKKVDLPWDHVNDVQSYGRPGQFLVSDGDGVTRWVDPPSGGGGGLTESEVKAIVEGYNYFVLPTGGISRNELTSSVKTSLNKADSAYQKPSTGIPASDIASGVIPDPVTDSHINSLIDAKLTPLEALADTILGVI